MFEVELLWETKFATEEELQEFRSLIAEVHYKMYALEDAYQEISREGEYKGTINTIDICVMNPEPQPAKFRMNQHVNIIPFKDDQFNSEGRVDRIDEENKRYWICNMNMPFMGTTNRWFNEDELESQQ